MDQVAAAYSQNRSILVISCSSEKKSRREKLTLSSVLVQMGSLSSVQVPEDMRDTYDRLSIDEIGTDTILVNTKSSQYGSSPGIDLETTIRDYTDYDLLPPFFTPCFRFGPGT
jgi:hypothetical protein